jgi:hypothetical protein
MHDNPWASKLRRSGLGKSGSHIPLVRISVLMAHVHEVCAIVKKLRPQGPYFSHQNMFIVDSLRERRTFLSLTSIYICSGVCVFGFIKLRVMLPKPLRSRAGHARALVGLLILSGGAIERKRDDFLERAMQVVLLRGASEAIATHHAVIKISRAGRWLSCSQR